jgi:transcriptional regulator with XRE-family HTH domain
VFAILLSPSSWIPGRKCIWGASPGRRRGVFCPNGLEGDGAEHYDAGVGIFKDGINDALRALRKRSGLRQLDIARARGRNEQGRLSRVETGREMPGVETIDAYLEITGASVYDLADLLVGERPEPAVIAEQVYQAFRLGNLSTEARTEALAKIHRLGWELARPTAPKADDGSRR